MSSSTNIRRQLGPARKRLADRLQGVVDTEEIMDVIQLKDLRTKLATNMSYHKKLTDSLAELDNLDEEETKIVEEELEKCILLDIEAQEQAAVLNDRILTLDDQADGLATENLRKQNDFAFVFLVTSLEHFAKSSLADFGLFFIF